jgi:heat shock protein HslJ
MKLNGLSHGYAPVNRCGIARLLFLVPFAAGLAASPALAQMSLSGGGPPLPHKQKEAPVPKGPTGPAEQQFPFGSTWLLDSIDGKPMSGDVPSFRLDDKLRATGFGGCNSFSMAFYPIKGQKLAAGAIATTKKSCGKPIDDTERTVLVGLHSLPTWHLESNGDLTVKGQTGTMLFHRGL